MLMNPGWNGETRGALEKLIRDGTGKGLPAVSDFDNTVIRGDIGEATLALMARDGVIAKEGIPEHIAPSFTSIGGDEVSLARCGDITVYYEAPLEATGHHGNDIAPLTNGYIWAVEIMQGLTVRDVIRATEKVHAMSVPGEMKTIEVTPGGSAYPVPFFRTEMVELLARLIDHGFDVWIVSASNAWTVRWMALRALNVELEAAGCGKGIAPEKVIGVTTLMRDREGRLLKDRALLREDPAYAAMDDDRLGDRTLTGLLDLPAPVYSGKVACILDNIGTRPYLAAGDSPGDLPMLAFAEHRLWIVRMDKPEYRKEFAARADRVGGSWMVQPVRINMDTDVNSYR